MSLAQRSMTGGRSRVDKRRQVAQIQGKPIYVIQDVALIPLASQSEANTAISQAREKLRNYIEEGNEDATAENESLPDDTSSLGGPDEASLSSPVTPPSELERKDSSEKGHKKTTSVAEDVIGKRGAYGRFAERWFSRAGWSADKRRTLGMSSEEDVSKTAATEASARPAQDVEEPIKAPPQDAVAVKDGSIQSPAEVGHPSDDMSMALLPKFFWNHHLTLPFIDAGQVNFVLPLMQGFIGQKAFTLQKDISTGQDAIVGASVEVSEHVAVEPEPEGVEEVGKSEQYAQIASLVDKHGTENHIGEEYQKYAESLNEDGGLDGKQIGFKWFDFHNICRGMKFENVSLLIQELETALSSYGWTVLQEDKQIKEQNGILRTNCMDCLDRTNVVQSATGRWALEQQLADQGFKIDLQSDPTTSWFNQVWADNGDAISRQYAGTAALKGDFTRTRKRNITGALTDFSLTLNRYYNNIFGDYFTQACIDYLLGRTNEAVFDDFEADMKSKDLAMNMTKVRQSAIETCAKIVIEESAEDLESGWTLISPHEPNTLRSLPLEECVVLVTNLSLYLCRFDWSIEKVSEYTKVDLDRITSLRKGTYITSTLTSKQRDEERNYGFVISYDAPSGKDIRRFNTRSLKSEKEPSEGVNAQSGAENNLEAHGSEGQRPENQEPEKKQEPRQHNQVRILAFKALPPRSSAMTSESATDIKHQSEKDIIESVCDDIQRVILRTNQAEADGKKDEDGTIHIEEKPIISLADAKKSTTYLESIGHSIKRLVWA
ncbi:MAG: hypothetical protein Q9165_002598 [Trypethelium subeluteriae]